MPEAATIIFTGRLRPESFAEFIRHRAGRLSLDAGLGAIGPERAEVSVTGEADLIDAFEMACSLGPIDCLVLDTHRRSGSSGRAVAARIVEAPS
jgi:hypothetical protein